MIFFSDVNVAYADLTKRISNAIDSVAPIKTSCTAFLMVLYSYMLLYIINYLYTMVFKYKIENLENRHLSIAKNACAKCFFQIIQNLLL